MRETPGERPTGADRAQQRLRQHDHTLTHHANVALDVIAVTLMLTFVCVQVSHIAHLVTAGIPDLGYWRSFRAVAACTAVAMLARDARR